jgi:4-diphosphocytidyl-2-C-methyl-D-erythritol kinase
MRVCTIEAPCKINLHLNVGEKRPDGFHELESLFVPLAFCDTLRFECTGNDGENLLSTSWQVPCEVIPDGKNLVLRAMTLFREQTGFKQGLKIALEKRIPLGAGLGGGSSDAASTLLALNLLSGAGLETEILREMAAFLGSDVPFFISGGAAFVSGRGELVETVKFPPGLWIVLAAPPFSSNTALAFALLDKMREREGVAISKETLPREVLIRALDGECEKWPFFNDFLPVLLNDKNDEEDRFAQNSDQLKAILMSLKTLGASFTGLSGAGSCCFGIFHDKSAAELALTEFAKAGNFAQLTFFLAHKANPVLK